MSKPQFAVGQRVKTKGKHADEGVVVRVGPEHAKFGYSYAVVLDKTTKRINNETVGFEFSWLPA